MQLVELSEDNRENYNNFVAMQRGGSFLQSWEWGEWQKNLGREAFRFFLTDNLEPLPAAGGSGTGRGNNIGAIQLIKISLPFGKYYLYAPYGPVLAQGEQNDELRIKNYEFLLQKKFPDCIFIRVEPKYHPFYSPHNLGGEERSGGVVKVDKVIKSSSLLGYQVIKTQNIQPSRTLIVDLSKSEEQLLSEMHPKTRYNIRLAQKHGVVIKSDLAVTPGHGLYFNEVIDQISETEKRQGFKGHGREYYKKLVDFFALQKSSNIKISLYKALYKNRLLASAIILDCFKVRTYLFGGSSVSDKNIMAPYLLHFQAMADARQMGALSYDFWGTETSSGKTPGFVRFKQGFGGGIQEYGGAYDLPVSKKMYWLYRIAKKLRI